MLGIIFRKAQNKTQDPAKLRRLVVDLIGGLLPQGRIEDGYLYVEYTKPKGALLLVQSGPPLAALGEVRLSKTDVAALQRVNNPRDPLPLSSLDELLLKALRRLHPPRS